MIPDGFRSRRSDTGLLWVVEQIPAPELWLPPAEAAPTFPAGQELAFEGFAFTFGPVFLTSDVYRSLVFGSGPDRSGEVRSSSIFDGDRGYIGIAKEDAAAGDELRVELSQPLRDVIDDVLGEIRELPETPA